MPSTVCCKMLFYEDGILFDKWDVSACEVEVFGKIVLFLLPEAVR